MSVASWCSTCFYVVLCVGFCTGHFVMLPLNLTYLHCFQQSFFEHLFNLFIMFQKQNFKDSNLRQCCHGEANPLLLCEGFILSTHLVFNSIEKCVCLTNAYCSFANSRFYLVFTRLTSIETKN